MNFINLSTKNLPYKDQLYQKLQEILEKGTFIGGEEVKEFEKEFANYLNVKYVKSCASGTDALFLALKALELKETDEVIIPSFTYIATASSVVNAGGKPVFCDVDKKSFNIDIESFESKITENTKAVIVVHMFGQCADMNPIMDIARKHNLIVIEDCAQSAGATYEGKQSGSIGDIGCFSFFPTKNLGCYGDGGAISSNNEELVKKIDMLKHQGQTKKYHHESIGYNSRLDSVQAAILRIKLPYLNEDIKKRQAQAGKYNTTLKNIETPFVLENAMHSYNQYSILVDDRDKYIKELEKQNIPSMVYYPLPLHLQPCFEYLGYNKGDLPNSEWLSEHILSLPIFI